MIEIIAGTNRPNSNTLNVAKAILKRYEAIQVPAQILDLCEIPISLFHGLSYSQKPVEFAPFSKRILDSKGLHIVVPEYNGSYPGVLKYFIDHLPFPEAFVHRCVAFTGLASGIWGGIRAVEQLQMVFGYRNSFILPERTFISAVHKKLKPDLTIDDPLIDSLLSDQVQKFSEFTKKLQS